MRSFDTPSDVGVSVFEMLGYRIVREVGRNIYLVHNATGRRSCIGRRNRDEQWLMGGNWTEPEKLHSGSESRH